MATEEQKRRKAAQRQNAKRIASGDRTERISGLSPEALSRARERASERANARASGNPPPPPVQPRRVPISDGWIARDREAIRRREQASGEDQMFGPNLRGGLPKSYDDNYPPYDTYPKYNFNRERMEAKRFSRSTPPDWADQGDFIPLTYDPTKTSWPANGFDHRRTRSAGYDRNRGIIRIKFFTDNSVYDYGVDKPIPPRVAYQFRLTQSPGRAVHAGPGWGGMALESYGYEKVS